MRKKIRYGNSVETMIADQLFKINKSDEIFRLFTIDCLGDINSVVEQER